MCSHLFTSQFTELTPVRWLSTMLTLSFTSVARGRVLEERDVT